MFRHTTVCLTFVSIKVSGDEGGGERRFSYDSDVEWSDYVVSRLLSRIQNFWLVIKFESFIKRKNFVRD